MELVFQELEENNERNVFAEEVKSCDRAFCDMTFLLPEDMPEG